MIRIIYDVVDNDGPKLNIWINVRKSCEMVMKIKNIVPILNRKYIKGYTLYIPQSGPTDTSAIPD